VSGVGRLRGVLGRAIDGLCWIVSYTCIGVMFEAIGGFWRRMKMCTGIMVLCALEQRHHGSHFSQDA
jgi:hypothetical protein